MEPRGDVRSWGRAVASAVLVVVVLVVVFAVVPDGLTKFVEVRSSALVRDLVISAWFASAIVATIWALVRLQRRGSV